MFDVLLYFAVSWSFAADFRDLQSDHYAVRTAAQQRLCRHAPLVEPILRLAGKDPETRRFALRLSRMTSCPASLAVLHPRVTFEIHGTFDGSDRRYHNVHSTTLQADRAWLQRRMTAGPHWEVLYYSVSNHTNGPWDLFAWIIHVYHLRARATQRFAPHAWTYWYRPEESQLALDLALNDLCALGLSYRIQPFLREWVNSYDDAERRIWQLSCEPACSSFWQDPAYWHSSYWRAQASKLSRFCRATQR